MFAEFLPVCVSKVCLLNPVQIRGGRGVSIFIDAAVGLWDEETPTFPQHPRHVSVNRRTSGNLSSLFCVWELQTLFQPYSLSR